MVAKQEWGTKRLCTSCGARYYDLRRNPITCPRCDEIHVPEVVVKTRRATTPKPAAKPKVAVVDPVVATDAGAGDVTPDPATAAKGKAKGDEDFVALDNDDEDGGKAEIIEDPSELGEDEDDMAEVIEGSREAADN